MHQILDGGSRDRYRKEQEKQLKNLQIALAPDRFAGEEPAALHAGIQRMPELKDQWGNPMAIEDAEKDARGIALISSNGTGIRRQPTMKENFQTLAQGAADAADALDENVWYPAEQGLWAGIGNVQNTITQLAGKLSEEASKKGWHNTAQGLKNLSNSENAFYEFEDSLQSEIGHAPETNLQRLAYNIGKIAPSIKMGLTSGALWSGMENSGRILREKTPKEAVQQVNRVLEESLAKEAVTAAQDEMLKEYLSIRGYPVGEAYEIVRDILRSVSG